MHRGYKDSGANFADKSASHFITLRNIRSKIKPTHLETTASSSCHQFDTQRPISSDTFIHQEADTEPRLLSGETGPMLIVTRRLILLVNFLIWNAFVVHLMGVQEAAAKPCHRPALAHLKQLSPQGYAVYRAYSDKNDFLHWISDCQDVAGGLATAVHETVHMLTDEKDAYPLVRGGTVYRVPESPDFFAPAVLASRFPANSPYVESYLIRGAASSADFFRYLLDEFNAYAHDLNTSIRLEQLENPDIETAHRDGLAAFMAFVTAYVGQARSAYPRTWRALQRPKVRGTISALWSQAEDIMGKSCHLHRIAQEAAGYLGRVCRANILHPLSQLLGRPPLCPDKMPA